MRINPTLYHDESDKGGTPPDTKPAEQAKPASADEIAAAVVKAVGDRTARAETGVLKSMAEQYGMSEADLKGVLDKAKADKAAQLPDEVQKRLDEAESKVRKMQVSTEVVKLGAELGLVDADTALLLIPTDAIKIDAKGEITGVKEALEALKTSKPYLFKVAEATATGQKANVGGKVTGNPNAITKEQFAKMNLRQRADLQAKDPALYKALKGE